ncbi:MAG: hypothetical protein PHW01_00885 [Patescibacteria group bacterium]|nr:hypothetical protein [Patescibacteria group bacterium]
MAVKILVVNQLVEVAINLRDNDMVLFQWGNSDGAFCRIYSDKDNVIEKLKTNSDFEKHESLFKSCFYCMGNIDEVKKKIEDLFS